MEVYKFLPKVRGGAQRAEGSVVEGKLLYYCHSKRLSPKTVSEVSKRTVRFYTVEALIGSTLFQCTEGFAVRTYLNVIKCSRVKTLR